jgi:Protein of unknown function (DUF3457).
MMWLDNKRIKYALETTFNEILDKRMRDLPVVNASLSVQAVGFNRFGEDWLGVLITPWFMNLMLLPGPNSHWRDATTRHKNRKALPVWRIRIHLG